MALIDILVFPHALILYDSAEKELLINKRGQISIYPKLPRPDSRYYRMQISDITYVTATNDPEGGTWLFGPLGYAFTAKKNSIIIETSANTYWVYNVSSLKCVEEINELRRR